MQRNKDIKLYFGDRKKSFDNLCRESFFGARSLTLLKQVHGTVIHCASEVSEVFVREGDALITNVPGCAIGVLTADCLPLIFYDQKRCAIGIAHAGWRGSVCNMSGKVVKEMQRVFGTEVSDLVIYFGPAARACCYEVQPMFCQNITSHKKYVLYRRGASLFFDNGKLNYLQLQSLGICDAQIIQDYHVCTICNDKYCSYRREKEDAGRQISAVVIRV